MNYTQNSNIHINGCEYMEIRLQPSNNSKQTFVLHCLYRHPGPLENNFLENLEKCIQTSSKKNDHI